MTKITLETVDGDYVTSAEVDEPTPLIIWNGRYFISDTFEPSGDETYTEVEPLMLPYAPMEAKPDYGEGEDA